MRRNLTAAGATLCVAALTLAACSGGGKSSTQSTGNADAPAKSGANVTLTMESSPETNLTANFNPYTRTSAVYNMGAPTFIYETLQQFNILKPNSSYPWLAASSKFSTDGKTLTFDLRKDVKWSDGQPFTATDVAFTFNLIKANSALNNFGVKFDTAKAVDPQTVEVTFSQPGFTQLYYLGGQIPIVPEHIWKTITNPGTYVDAKPVGTGAYVPGNFTAQGFTLDANPHYWQPNKPAIGHLQFPAYDSNTSANLALENGQLDWAGNFVNAVQKVFVEKNPTTNHYWFPPVNTVSLIPNLTKWPLNNVAVRKAISLAINRDILSQDAENGYEPVATSATGLVLPRDKDYMPSDTTGDSLARDPEAAKKVLSDAGFTMVNNVWSLNGKSVTFNVEDPTSYTDYATAAQAIARDLSSIGMQVKFSGVSADKWNSDIASGNFDSAIHWSENGPSPFYMYQSWLDPSLSSGATATGNYERYTEADAAQFLSQFQSSGDPAVQKEAIAGLGKIVANKLPIIPLMYGVDWSETSTSKVTGWPSADNPYMPAQPSAPFDEYTVLQLKPA